MGFEPFLAAIKADSLRTVALHWRAVRRGRRMPAWRDIDPVALGPHLPIVWSWKYDRAADDFVGRLSGEEITRAFGRSLRGAKHADIFPRDRNRKVFDWHRRVVTEPALAHGEGLVFSHVGRLGIGERIIMPLAEDGSTGDGIFGATAYEIADATDDGAERRESYELRFFPLA